MTNIIKPRHYQINATNNTVNYILNNKTGNPLVVSPTGTGKSIIPSMISNAIMKKYPWCRIGIIAHKQELVEQNHKKIALMYPKIQSGIYCAGLNRRDLYSQVVFASIGSIYKKAKQLGKVNILMIDESHAVPFENDTQYRKFVSDLQSINEKMRIIGLTATPYRLRGGSLLLGKNSIFDDICFEYSVLDAINDGYLTRVVPKGMKTKFDLSKIKMSASYDNLYDQEKILDEKTQEAVKEIISCGHNRSTWLIFCSGEDHADHVRDEIRKYGISCESVHGNTPNSERKNILDRLSSGELRCVTNINILTTGYDNPKIDMIVMLRKTASPGLYSQMIGRGLRLIDGRMGDLETAEERKRAVLNSEKPDCLVLDFVGNGRDHGPIDRIVPPPPPGEKKSNVGPAMKECPNCNTLLYISTMTCTECAYVFPKNDKKISGQSYGDAILSDQIKPEWHNVKNTKYSIIKIHGRFLISAQHVCDLQTYSYLLEFDSNMEWAKTKAIKWWSRMMPNVPMTKSAFTFKAIEKTLPIVRRVKVLPKRDSKGKLFYDILDMDIENA